MCVKPDGVLVLEAPGASALSYDLKITRRRTSPWKPLRPLQDGALDTGTQDHISPDFSGAYIFTQIEKNDLKRAIRLTASNFTKTYLYPANRKSRDVDRLLEQIAHNSMSWNDHGLRLIKNKS